jgi:cytochrome c553
MKRSLLAVLACALVGAVHANEAAKAAPKGDATRGQPIASTVCGACHGADGNSMIPQNPKLAGQHADYLFKQMQNFKAAEGKQPERANPIMTGMIAAFDEGQMRDIAAYFAAQKPAVDASKPAAEPNALGLKLWRAGDLEKGLPACAGCHGPAGAGIPAQFPRLAGQHVEYTEAQLKAFRDGSRANDPNKMMRMIALKMTDAEVKAVSELIATQR